MGEDDASSEKNVFFSFILVADSPEQKISRRDKKDFYFIFFGEREAAAFPKVINHDKLYHRGVYMLMVVKKSSIRRNSQNFGREREEKQIFFCWGRKGQSI
jgi:hypothetical protein